MNKHISRILALCLILALLLCCGAQAFAEKTPIKPKASPTPTPAADAAAALKDVQKLLDDKKLYDAALACYDGYCDYPDRAADFEALWQRIADACAGKMPKTGELKRSFQYQGGNELHVIAASGNVDLTAVDTDSKESVRVFIREGEEFTINLPSGKFDLSFKLGEIWFDDEIGFGDFCEDYPNVQTLDIKYVSDGSWVTYYSYTWEI